MTELVSKICAEIESAGVVPFSRFMEMALYWPQLGYYERQEEIGRHGDFYTSISVGTLFGELLAFQFAEWFEDWGRQNVEIKKVRFQIVEAGAHKGQLALDILNWLKSFRPGIFEQLDYHILEPSARHREWQRKTLVEFLRKVSWNAGWSDFASYESDFTVVFSNELFDSMPVRRFSWDAKAKTWVEWGVGYNGGLFIWRPLLDNQRAPVPFLQIDPELLEVLPDGFSTEICPSAPAWWKEAASVLRSGKLMAIDYGILTDEFFLPQRSRGTLRAYYQHQANLDLLAKPGEQDLTAHVNFSILKETGEEEGLKTDALVSQAKFLTEIAGKALLRPAAFCEWNEKRAKQFQTLTHPNTWAVRFEF